jgi:hypothetical protein
MYVILFRTVNFSLLYVWARLLCLVCALGPAVRLLQCIVIVLRVQITFSYGYVECSMLCESNCYDRLFVHVIQGRWH